MIRRSQSMVRALVAALFTYLLAGGATFNGILFPELKALTLGWVTLLALAWLFVRWRHGWKWHRTVLDGAFPLWALSFLLSLLANTEIARRILIGLWYMGLYIAVWYVLHDLLANGAVSREMLIDGLLIGGVVVLYFAGRQLYSFVITQPDVLTALARLPRPVGTIGNPNALGGFLVVLIPFVMARLLTTTSRAARYVLGIYATVALLLLVLSASRGAWAGTAAGLMLWGLLYLAQRQLLSPEHLGEWWQSQPARPKAMFSTIGVLVFVAALLGVAAFVRTFSEPGRQLFLRTEIYEAAIQLFFEKPILGHGLFTFGRGLARMQSMPPETPHSHAHSIPLQIAAELGSVGVVVLVITVIVLFRAMRRNWRAANGRNQTMVAGVIAAVSAFGVHQLTDIPAMMPAIALCGLLALVLAVAPLTPVPTGKGWQRRGYSLGATILWLALLITGFWSTTVYSEYVATLRDISQGEDFRTAAERVQSVINADPSLALYHLEQGELFGLAAYEGDLDAAREGIAAYERFIAVEPVYAVAWANKAALHWQLGEQQQAIDAMQRAVELAPRSWELATNLGIYLETYGEEDEARLVYERALAINPCALEYPEWPDAPIKQALFLSWRETCWNEGKFGIVGGEILGILNMVEDGERNSILNRLAEAERASVSGQDQAWVHLGYARLARFDGDDETAERELETARSLLQRGFLDNDYVFGSNIAHSQFLRAAIQRLFLPQIYFPTAEPLLLRLIAET